MALFLFTRKMLAGEPIPVFNYGHHTRDFTFIDDIVDGIIKASDQPASPDPDWDGTRPDPHSSAAPFRIFNVGNSAPVQLSDYIDALEAALGVRANRTLLPMQAGDVPDTFADTSRLTRAVGYKPAPSVREGVERFVAWYRDYYQVPNG